MANISSPKSQDSTAQSPRSLGLLRSPVILLKSPVTHNPHHKHLLSKTLSHVSTSRSPLSPFHKATSIVKSSLGGTTISDLGQGEVIELTDEQVVDEVVDIIKNEERKKYTKGLFYLFMVVATWVIALQLTNNIMKDGDYEHPLFCAYINGSFFMLFGMKRFFKFVIKSIMKLLSTSEIPSSPESFLHSYGSVDNEETSKDDDDDGIVIDTPDVQLSFRQMFIVAFQAAILYFLNCSLGTAALGFTSASNQTILATTSSLFTLIIGSIFKVERITLLKVISIIVSISGILLITISDSVKNESILETISRIGVTEFGDLMALTGACAYSGYLILLRLKLGEETNDEDDSIVFGLLGFNTLTLLFPILVLAQIVGIEPLSLPESKTVLLFILISGTLNAISDYCASIASLLTSPLLTSLSLSTAIPVSMICDSIFYKDVNTSIWYYLGIILIFSSFIFTSLEDEEETAQTAVKEAIDEAIAHDGMLSPLLSPYLSGGNGVSQTSLNSIDDDIPGFNIDESVASPATSSHPSSQVVVAGGKNHKYFIREINSHVIGSATGSIGRVDSNNQV